eukprot:gene4908-9789_t
MMRVGFLILSFWTLSIFSKTNKFILTKQEFEKDNNLSWTNHSPLLTVLWTCKYGSYLNYITDGWEGDYIREIFPPPKFYHTQNQSSSAQIVVYNTMSDLDYLKSYIKTNKVLILIHLSDEYQGLFEIANKGVELYHMVPLVLRHYSFHAFRNLSNPYTNALINGAIPVVVANPQEIKFSFDYDGFTPPFLFANTWDDALQTCKNMSLSDIHKRRIEIMKWYLNRLNAVTHRIKYVLDVFSNIPELCTNNGYGLCGKSLDFIRFTLSV